MYKFYLLLQLTKVLHKILDKTETFSSQFFHLQGGARIENIDTGTKVSYKSIKKYQKKVSRNHIKYCNKRNDIKLQIQAVRQWYSKSGNELSFLLKWLKGSGLVVI